MRTAIAIVCAALAALAAAAPADAYLPAWDVRPEPAAQVLPPGILQVPDHVLEPGPMKRYILSGGPGGAHAAAAAAPPAALPALRAAGYDVSADVRLDLHDFHDKVPDGSRIAELASALDPETYYNYTGQGVTVAIVDTGVDFSNPDIRHSLARDGDNAPIMLDADGQGIVITNATFAANIDEHGIIRNLEGPLPENATSKVYRTRDGIFLDVEQGGNGTVIEVYNSLFPAAGPEPTFNGTLDTDMKIGRDHRDYIRSQSGMYRLGAAYMGSLSGPQAGIQVVPVLVVDSQEPGVYDTIIPDMSTSWEDWTRNDLPAGEEPEYDFDFTDEEPIRLGEGREFLVYDGDGDGEPDYSAGTAGAMVVDVYGAISGNKSGMHGALQAVNGTLLPALDPDGRFFGLMTDHVTHGTASAATVASRGMQEYDIYNDTNKYVIRGVAPGASILPVKALWLGDGLYASLWLAGMDSGPHGWEYAGAPRAHIMSNSWGVSSFPLLGALPGADPLSVVHTALAAPRSIHRDYPGMVIVTSAGNSGHGYGTIGLPAASPLAITVGAATSSVYVGYGPFEGQPRFGNGTSHAGHMADFSSRGPGYLGDPKPDLLGIGAHGFVPAPVTTQGREPDERPFRLFGGTSMAAPMAAGAAALVIQALHERDGRHSPAHVKAVLVSTARDAGSDPLVQGAGMVDAGAAVAHIMAEPGSLAAYTDASYRHARGLLDGPLQAANATALGLGRLVLPDSPVYQPSWFAGHLMPGGRSWADIVIENPTDRPARVTVEPQRLELSHRSEFSSETVPMLPEPGSEAEGAYAPGYVRLGDVRKYGTLASYMAAPGPVPEAALMVLTARFPFGEFMNATDPVYANDMRISSLYVYDWQDADNDTAVSSPELELVTRAGSWGTVQEARVAAPAGAFGGVPLVGIYPVPERYSFWTGLPAGNASSMPYTVAASYYDRAPWGAVWLSARELEVPAGGLARVRATVYAPPDAAPGAYQGTLLIDGGGRQVRMPVGYAVVQPAYGGQALVAGAPPGPGPYGAGHVRGAFDMAGRYMAGDWRQYRFDVQDPAVNAAVFEAAWQDPDTSLSMFAAGPDGRLVQSTSPPGAFGGLAGWPTADWLGVTPFSEGGGFYPVKGRDETSAGMYVPVGSTGLHTVLVRSGLFGGAAEAEEVSLAAAFASVPRPGAGDPAGGR